MAASARHRGWLYRKNNGVLAATYNGVESGTTALSANAVLDGVLIGTPVVTAMPVDSLIISNTVASGDIVAALNDGSGNSWEYMRLDASAGLIVFNEASSNLDFRVETDAMAYGIYSDGAKNALVLGSNTDTSSADQLITVSRAARTATANTAYYDLRVAPAGAVTVPTGTTAVVATVSMVEPNVTATGTVTRAATLHIASQPTEGTTANAAIYFGAAANIAGTTSITINEDSEDVDFRIESNDNSNMFVLDAGLNAIGIGGAAASNQTVTITNAAVAATGRVLKLSGTIAAAALTDGYGAFEVDITLSGSPTNHSAAASAWINITGGTVPVGTYICARNDGIYETTDATITNAKLIFGARMSYIATDTDGLRFPFSLNTNNAAITAVFDCQNYTDFGAVANAGTALNIMVPFCRDAGGTVRYVPLYSLQ